MRDKVLHAPPDIDLFATDPPRLDDALTRRIGADPENVERGLAQLVLTIVELLRQLLERQALRRIDACGPSADSHRRRGTNFPEPHPPKDALPQEAQALPQEHNHDH